MRAATTQAARVQRGQPHDDLAKPVCRRTCVAALIRRSQWYKNVSSLGALCHCSSSRVSSRRPIHKHRQMSSCSGTAFSCLSFARRAPNRPRSIPPCFAMMHAAITTRECHRPTTLPYAVRFSEYRGARRSRRPPRSATTSSSRSTQRSPQHSTRTSSNRYGGPERRNKRKVCRSDGLQRRPSWPA